ncbi:unnamed protein product [Paramecium pentaurelia]|uniref:Uncharacterized protein n=1 Tax=Paramecium pentaurelia TaxID=43138 RepID=A0A8S1VXJ8_9CILI|nr:unnamed protein product [Paramecium pentaurelia]
MKVIIIISLLLTFSMAAHFDKKTIHKHIEDLHKSKWGKTLLSMMALHSQSQGPVDELVQAIEDLVADLQEELDVLEFNFGQRTNEHHKIVTTLEQEINQAVLDYQRTQDTLENLLYPRRENLKNKIEQIQEYQEANRKTLAEAQLKRENEKEEFEAQLADFNSAIESTDQALELLYSLRNQSLGQVTSSNIRKIHVQLNMIEQRIRAHSKHGPLIKALIQLANEQNFSNQDIVGTILDKLNEFRNAVVDAINDATALEAENQQEFEERVEQLDHEFSEFGKQISKITVDLEATITKINELTEYSAQRDADRQRFQSQLNIENDSYAEETKIYQDMKNEYIREQEVAESAEKVVKSADFSNIKI